MLSYVVLFRMWHPRKRPRPPSAAAAPRKWQAALATSDAEDGDLPTHEYEADSADDALPPEDNADGATAGTDLLSDGNADGDATDLLPELARWCRRSVREGGAAASATLCAIRDAGSSHPRRVLLALSATAAGRAFLQGCARQYETALSEAPSPRERARVLAALGSVHEALDALPAAVNALRRSLRLLDGGDEAVPAELPADPPPECASPQQLLSEIGATLRPGPRASSPLRAAVVSELVRVLRRWHALRVEAAWLRRSPALPEGATLDVPRESASLSVEAFLGYARRRVPVVMPLPVGAGPPQPWTRERLRRLIGGVGASAGLRRRVSGSPEWAGLEAAAPPAAAAAVAAVAAVAAGTTVGGWIDGMEAAACEAEAEAAGSEPAYLFDWSLAQHCPQLLRDELVVPRWFCNDLLQRTAPGSLWREAWPSLFLGPRGSRCALHVDTGGTHFFMMLFEGEKRWTLFPPTAAPLLRPSYRHGHDAAFGCDPHAAAACTGAAEEEADDAAPPLLRHLDRYEVTLRAGEILFVPAGVPHAVTNLSHTAAISANFVLEDNLELCREECAVAAAHDPEAARLLAQLDSASLDARMDLDVGHQSWREFKRE